MTLDSLAQGRRLLALCRSVVPLQERTKKPASDVLPRDAEGAPTWASLQITPPTDDDLHRWFGNGAERNTGIVLGPISNLVAVDSDTPEGEAWCAEHLTPTPMMTRTHRGFHRFYRLPTGQWLGVDIPELIAINGEKIADVKSSGYVVAPGSIHASGHVYAEVTPWPTTIDALPELPMAAIARIGLGMSDNGRASEPLPETFREGTRNADLFREGCRLRRLGWSEREIAAALLVLNRERGRPPLDEREVEGIARSCARYEAAADTYPLTDTGNAEFFAAVAGNDSARFDHGRQAWFLFSGHHWIPDRTGEVDSLALEAVRARQAAAFKITDSAERTGRLKWALGSESRTRRDNLVRLASKLETLAVTGDDWDMNPMLLGVANGVIDLETGRLRGGRPADAVTKVAPVAFDAAARCDRWDRFMREVFADHPEIADYLQRVLGYGLTGITTAQTFWILYGSGANGKSTLMEVVMRHVLGEAYAWTMPFPATGWSNAMSEYQKASLVGQRVVAASEVTRRGELNEELIKSLTGGDTINARHPYGRPFQYVPIAKFFLRVNEKPVIRDESHGMWRRVKLVPFTQTFAVDTTLAATLAAEAQGILAWAVRGCLAWQRDGLRHPDVVEAATEEYRGESDPLAEFFEEHCVITPKGQVAARALFDEYRGWCDSRQLRDVDRLNQTTFGLRLKARFEAREGRHVVYRGIALRQWDRGEM